MERMTTMIVNANPLSSQLALTIAQFRSRILADDGVPPDKRREVASALSSLARAVRMPPDILPADPGRSRATLKDFTPAIAGITPGLRRNGRGPTAAQTRLLAAANPVPVVRLNPDAAAIDRKRFGGDTLRRVISL
jgi:hypothetical protein